MGDVKTLETVGGEHCLTFSTTYWPPILISGGYVALTIPMHYELAALLSTMQGCSFRVGNATLENLLRVNAPPIFDASESMLVELIFAEWKYDADSTAGDCFPICDKTYPVGGLRII